MRKKLKTALLFVFLLFIGFGKVQPIFSQPTNCIPGDPDYDPDLCAPIDGFLSVLIVSGVGYGLAKNRSTRRKEEPDESQ